MSSNIKYNLKEKKIKSRILKELKTLANSDEYTYYHSDDDIYFGMIRFKVANGIYKGQEHLLEVKFKYGINKCFPRDPPLITFKTPIWHPNIGDTNNPSSGGIICLDIIKDKWTPALDIESIIISIISLLEDPNINSPQNTTAAKEYSKNKTKFNITLNTYYYKRIEKYKKYYAKYFV